MSKVQLPIVLVVEGTSDKAFLSNFIDCEFVLTGGSAISRETIDYLKEIGKQKQIVVLTDPDYPGQQIRSRIIEEVPEASHAFVRKEKSIKHGKVGVAESEKEEVLLALSHIVPGVCPDLGNLTISDLFDLGLSGYPDSVIKRKKVSDSLHVGEGNAKTFLKRINALGIKKERLKEIIDG